jgi:hypothetical protein
MKLSNQRRYKQGRWRRQSTKCPRLGVGRVRRLVITGIRHGGQDQSVQGGGHNKGDEGQDCRYGQRSFKVAGECGVQEEVIKEEKMSG